jgi:hypothetical protein
MATITNQIAAPALRGQGVKVTLNTPILSVSPALTLGATCTAGGSSNVGTIARIDTFGNSFIVNPNNPAGSFSGSLAGQLAASVVITY